MINWVSHNAVLKALSSLTIWPRRQVQWCASTTGKRSRRCAFADAANQCRQGIEVMEMQKTQDAKLTLVAQGVFGHGRPHARHPARRAWSPADAAESITTLHQFM